MYSVLLALSGGLDSAALLGYYLQNGQSVMVANFIYGSKHNKYEVEAARKVVSYYQALNKQVEVIHIDVRGAFSSFQSSLMEYGTSIPEGHYNAESMRSTVVPSRNLIFASILVGLAESKNIPVVALGVHSGDHFIYPDCRPNFIQALLKTAHLASDGKVTIDTPFSNLSKADIVKMGIGIGVPFHLTRTCYKAQSVACGVCGSCVERKEAFELLNLKDPIEYEQR